MWCRKPAELRGTLPRSGWARTHIAGGNSVQPSSIVYVAYHVESMLF